MTPEILVPVEGCWVRKTGMRDPLGQVIGRREGRIGWQVKVNWGNGCDEWVDIAAVIPGFPPNATVQDVPLSNVRQSLGPGQVVGTRRLGERHQVLVQLHDTGRSLWLPYENLRRIKDVRLRYERAEAPPDSPAERFRLKILAQALESWNHMTGALDRLDVDPLPHQIQLVHRILNSQNYNWLIADDVGLGKTIEVGLLLAALTRKGSARRVLIVAPAGLTRQWQDELKYKFDQDYEIYGRDFNINRSEHWKLHDHAIVSLDLAKRDEHLQLFRQAGRWDVVVFDESHKLTRYASGERAQRYRLAEAIRPTTDALLLLTGTPHQGYADRFAALLELVRPDLKPQIHAIGFQPEIVGEMILRNRKTEVTDADGNFVFKGQQVHRYAVQPSSETLQFQRLLREYLVKGYRAGRGSGAAGRAIGFVMTTYRKLASSSIAAIERALTLRRERLLNARSDMEALVSEDTEDLFEGGDEHDDLTERVRSTKATEFFTSELELLDRLLEYARVVRRNDEKLRIFIEDAVQVLASKGEKLLIFTEYRATQEYLKRALEAHFPQSGAVLLINGSMSLDEKLDAIDSFNNGINAFLVSTEAGGEGLNLHRSCHIVVNYDLPWNPARLVQRIGRLYRYGQQKMVLVLNLHARDSFDNAAIDLMLNRVAEIARAMAPVGSEFNERLYTEIVGEILENMDFASILGHAESMELEHTKEEIDRAVERAKSAKLLQDEILSHAASYDPGGLQGTLGVGMQHVLSFFRAMLPFAGCELEQELYGGSVFQVRLPEELRGHFAEFGQRTIIRLTADRRLAQTLKDVFVLDFGTEFFRYLVERARGASFDGSYASVSCPQDGMLAGVRLRWQNDQGEPLTEEFATLFADTGGSISSNPTWLCDWLLKSGVDGPAVGQDRRERATRYAALVAEADAMLAREASKFKHPNAIIELAAADCSSA